jgi:hypothetical protein
MKPTKHKRGDWNRMEEGNLFKVHLWNYYNEFPLHY